jgi:hypothetical protein
MPPVTRSAGAAVPAAVRRRRRSSCVTIGHSCLCSGSSIMGLRSGSGLCAGSAGHERWWRSDQQRCCWAAREWRCWAARERCCRGAHRRCRLETIADSGLDGISLDIEKQSTDATGMTLLVQELRKAMKADNAHLQLSFCLGSRPSVKGGYNVTALSESLDFILPMYVGITSCLASIWS